LHLADDPKNSNARLFPEGGKSGAIENPVVDIEADFIDTSKYKLPDVEPENMCGMPFLREREVYRSIYRAENVERLEKDDAEGE